MRLKDCQCAENFHVHCSQDNCSLLHCRVSGQLSDFIKAQTGNDRWDMQSEVVVKSSVSGTDQRDPNLSFTTCELCNTGNITQPLRPSSSASYIIVSIRLPAGQIK